MIEPIPNVPGARGHVIPLDGGAVGIIISGDHASIAMGDSLYRVQRPISLEALQALASTAAEVVRELSLRPGS